LFRKSEFIVELFRQQGIHTRVVETGENRLLPPVPGVGACKFVNVVVTFLFLSSHAQDCYRERCVE
jgi:hypothetical protein